LARSVTRPAAPTEFDPVSEQGASLLARGREERWDIHRDKPDDHLAFGKGRHFCPGAPIGRVEARIGLRVLFERLSDLRTVTPLQLDIAPIAILPKRQTLPVHW
jgi:cytochrome P450